MDIYIDAGVSLFDFLITIVLIWAVYRGYKRGSIIHSVALLVLLAGIVVSAKVSYMFYGFLADRSRIPLINLPVIIFAVLFVFSVIGAHFVANKVTGNVGKEPKGFTNKILGILVNVVKYLFMTSIVLIFIFKLDASFEFIHKNEKQRTKLYYPVLSIAPSAFKILRFPEINPVPIGKPEEVKREDNLQDDLDDF